MEFVVGLSCFLALIGLVMLLLWSIERIEARLRRTAPRLFNSWLQLHAIAALMLVVACIIVWPAPGQALTFNVLVVPIMAASLAYLAPLAFGLVVAIHTPGRARGTDGVGLPARPRTRGGLAPACSGDR